MKKYIIILAWIFTLPLIANAQLASDTCHNKFLGNITHWNFPNNAQATTFGTYWNQVTPENSSKWTFLEPSRDVMSWGGMDAAYNYAKANNMPIKYHTFVWGQQYPAWVDNLTAVEVRQEIEELMSLVATRYPDIEMIDVLNEPLHAIPAFKDSIYGDNGLYGSGYDWIIWTFEKARQYFPNAELLINDYHIVDDLDNIRAIINITDTLKARGLIDGIGIQCHRFNLDHMDPESIDQNLDSLALSGLPIYVSELDMEGTDGTDNEQLIDYISKFPVFWEHPAVAGITLWGYIEAQTWQEEAYLLNTDSTERPALVWLKSYMDCAPDTSGNIRIRARGTTGNEYMALELDGEILYFWQLGTSYQDFYYNGNSTGVFRIHFVNDGSGMDVQVDLLEVDGVIYETENQPTNTGYHNGVSCGGSYGELLHCAGYIQFGIGVTSITEHTISPINVFPNPATDRLTIANSGGEEWKIFSLLGKCKLKGMVSTIDITSLTPGIYILIINEQRIRFVKK